MVLFCTISQFPLLFCFCTEISTTETTESAFTTSTTAPSVDKISSTSTSSSTESTARVSVNSPLQVVVAEDGRNGGASVECKQKQCDCDCGGETTAAPFVVTGESGTTEKRLPTFGLLLISCLLYLHVCLRFDQEYIEVEMFLFTFLQSPSSTWKAAIT